MRNQLSLKQNEINTLQTNLNESSSRAGEVEGAKVELQKAKENAKVGSYLFKFIGDFDKFYFTGLLWHTLFFFPHFSLFKISVIVLKRNLLRMIIKERVKVIKLQSSIEN